MAVSSHFRDFQADHAPCFLTAAAVASVVGMTPEEIAALAHLRRARDLIDRDYAQPLDVPAMARAALMSPAHFSRKFRAAYGETPTPIS